MKVAWLSVNPHMKFGGQTRVTREVCQRLSASHEVTALGWGGQSFSNEPLGYDFLPIAEKDAKTAISAIKHVNPDVVICSHDPWMYPYLPQLKKELPKCKIIGYFTLDSTPMHGSWLPIFRACDLIIVPSVFSMNAIRCRQSDIPVRVVPYGVDRNTFYRTHESREEARRQLANDSILDKFVLMFIGTNTSRKNVGAIMDAFNHWNERNAYLLLFVHPVGQAMDIEDVLCTLPARPRVKVEKGFIDDAMVNATYNIADGLCHPAMGEAFGLSLLEAQATGLPVITTDWSASPELVRNGYNGFLVPAVPVRLNAYGLLQGAVDYRLLAQKMDDLYEAKLDGDWEYMSERALETASKYSWENTTSLIEGYLSEVVENGGIGPNKGVTVI